MGLLAGALSFLGFFAFLVWFKFFGGGCFLWFFRSFTAVSALFFVFFVGDFLSFLFVGGLFFGFLQFFAFFVLPLGLLFLVKVGLRLAFAFLVLALVGLSYMTFLGRASFGASASLFVLVALALL